MSLKRRRSNLFQYGYLMNVEILNFYLRSHIARRADALSSFNHMQHQQGKNIHNFTINSNSLKDFSHHQL